MRSRAAARETEAAGEAAAAGWFAPAINDRSALLDEEARLREGLPAHEDPAARLDRLSADAAKIAEKKAKLQSSHYGQFTYVVGLRRCYDYYYYYALAAAAVSYYDSCTTTTATTTTTN